MIKRLFPLKTPGLTPPLLNLERQSGGLVRQPKVSSPFYRSWHFGQLSLVNLGFFLALKPPGL
jgi:hypothetical protein